MTLSQMPKIGFRAKEAASYIGVSQSTFLRWVEEGLMPKPRRVGGCKLWRGDELKDAFLALSSGEPVKAGDAWDKAVGLD